MKQLFSTSTPWVFILWAAAQVGGSAAGAVVTPVAEGETTVSVLATDPTALLGATTGAFTFIRSGPVTEEMQVPFAYSGTAVLGTDFEEADSKVSVQNIRSVTIPKGMYATDLVILPKANPRQRGNKTVDVTLDARSLASSSASVEAKYAKAEVRIVDNIFNDNPPTVSLTTPAPDSVLTLPVTVIITAEASDVDDEIQKVSFYANDSFLGAAISSPFVFRWVNPKQGEYDLFARAVDQAGKSTLSQPVRIKVTGVSPTVTITSPTDKTGFPPQPDVPVKVDATGIGVLTVQMYYDGANLLGELRRPPYQWVWSKVPAGRHTLTARVTDSVGQTASASIQITVADLAPTVKIVSPTSGSNFTKGQAIVLAARATATDAAVKDVTFWVNRRILGKGTPSAADPAVYEFIWLDPKPNFYLIQATATNSNGTEGTSDAVYLSVSDN